MEAPGCPTIDIVVHSQAIDVCYRTVHALVSGLLFATRSELCGSYSSPLQSADSTTTPTNDSPNFDAVIHLGLAQGRNYYSIESCANRDGYCKKDVCGKNMEGDTFWRDAYGAPPVLRPTIDIIQVARHWRASADAVVKVSANAGRYLCEYLFFASMLQFWRRNSLSRPIMFCHVPAGHQTEDLERGRKVILALIVSIVMSETNANSNNGERSEGDLDVMYDSDGDGS